MSSSKASVLAFAAGTCSFFKLRFGGSGFCIVNGEFDDSRFVEQRLGGAVLHCLANVVDIGVFAEDSRRAAVVAIQWRAGEADEGCVRQRITHPLRGAFDEAVLAAVRFVGQHNHLTWSGD